MEVVNSKKMQLLTLGGFIVVTTLTLGAISPINSPYNFLLSSYAMELMLIFLLIGFVGLFFRNNATIFINFSACIALCSFLKENSSQSFSYTNPTADVQIRVAHLVLDDKESIQKFNNNTNSIEANFLSIQTPIEPTLEKQLTEKLSKKMPYWQKTTCNNNLTLFVFSTYELRNLDTLYCDYDNTVSLVGTMFIDNNHKEISFLSTQVSVENNNNNSAKKHLASLSEYIQKNCKNKPLLTLNGPQLTAWSPEVIAFKEAHQLSDSRVHLNQNAKDEYIFYSKDLMCINFAEILGGDGVIATYQFKEKTITTTQDKSENRSMLGAAL